MCRLSCFPFSVTVVKHHMRQKPTSTKKLLQKDTGVFRVFQFCIKIVLGVVTGKKHKAEEPTNQMSLMCVLRG